MRSDFEKLEIAKRHIQLLEKEIEVLKAEVQNQFKQRKKAELELKIEINKKDKLTAEEKLKIKSDLYIQQQNDSIKSLRSKLKDYKGKYEKAHSELVQVKMKRLNEE